MSYVMQKALDPNAPSLAQIFDLHGKKKMQNAAITQTEASGLWETWASHGMSYLFFCRMGTPQAQRELGFLQEDNATQSQMAGLSQYTTGIP